MPEFVDIAPEEIGSRCDFCNVEGAILCAYFVPSFDLEIEKHGLRIFNPNGYWGACFNCVLALHRFDYVDIGIRLRQNGHQHTWETIVDVALPTWQRVIAEAPHITSG